MEKYEVVQDEENCQIIQDKNCTDRIYINVGYYAKMASADPEAIEQKVRSEIVRGVVDLGTEGVEGIQGRYLIPTEVVFIWLMTDCPIKSVMIGREAVVGSMRDRFYELKQN